MDSILYGSIAKYRNCIFSISSEEIWICYLTTGDPDCILSMHDPAAGSESCQSRGIVKSTDGGKTWRNRSESGIVDGKPDSAFWKYPSLKVVRKILIHPKSPMYYSLWYIPVSAKPNRLMDFIYRSVDAGKKLVSRFVCNRWVSEGSGICTGKSGCLVCFRRTIHMSTDCGCIGTLNLIADYLRFTCTSVWTFILSRPNRKMFMPCAYWRTPIKMIFIWVKIQV